MAPHTRIIRDLVPVNRNLSLRDIQAFDHKGISFVKIYRPGMGFPEGTIGVNFSDGFVGPGGNDLKGISSPSQIDLAVRRFLTRVNCMPIGTSQQPAVPLKFSQNFQYDTKGMLGGKDPTRRR